MLVVFTSKAQCTQIHKQTISSNSSKHARLRHVTQTGSYSLRFTSENNVGLERSCQTDVKKRRIAERSRQFNRHIILEVVTQFRHKLVDCCRRDRNLIRIKIGSVSYCVDHILTNLSRTYIR